MKKKESRSEKLFRAKLAEQKVQEENLTNEVSVEKIENVESEKISTSEEKNKADKPKNIQPTVSKITLSEENKLSKSILKIIADYSSEKKNVTIYKELFKEIKRIAIDKDLDYSTAVSYFAIIGMKKEGYL